MAWSGDGAVEFEVSKRGLAVTYGSEQAEWASDGVARRYSESHIALCVDRPAAEILEIAGRVGWPARLCARGRSIFHLVEVWGRGARSLIEMLDPEQTAEYREAVTPAKW